MNHIDKMFKHKLEHYHVDIPDGTWENIASRLPEPKRKLRPWWAFASVMFVIMVSGITSYIMLETNTQAIAHAKFINTSETKNKAERQVSIGSHDKHNVLIADATTLNAAEATSETLNDQIIENTIGTSFTNQTKTIVSPAKKYTPKTYSAILDNDIQEVIESRNVVNIPLLATEMKALNNTNNSVIFAKNIYAKDKPVKACPFVFDVQNKSVDVYFSHDMVSKQLSSSPALESYKNMRLETESPMYSFSAGARFGYNISYRWNLHTGFNYSQINEKFNYVDPESSKTIITTTIDYVYDNGRIIDSIITQKTEILPGTTIHTVYNKYRTFDIPVIGRYTLYANKYFSLSAMAGVYVNISLLQRGMILDANNNKPISLNSTDDEGRSMFKTQLGLTGYGSLSLAYHLTNRLDLLIEPNLRLQTITMTNDNYPLNQRDRKSVV